jgi:glycogen synthase
MRILMTADTGCGVWGYVLELARALEAYDVGITLAVMGPAPTPEQAQVVATLANVELVAHPFALEWMPDAAPDIEASGEWLLGLAQRTRADVVHINGYAHAALPFGVPVVVAAHSCACSWYRAVRGTDAPPVWDEYRRRVVRGLNAADVVVAPTEALLRAILDAHRVGVRGRVIPHGRSPEGWAPSGKEPFVLAEGRMWDQAKGLIDLAMCAPRLAWPIRVVGPTTAPAAAGTDVVMSGVELLGELPQTELARCAAQAAIYALPARYEPFGLQLVEAALSGCALVVGDIATLHEVWGEAAVYAPPGDVDALERAISGLIADPARRRSLAESARARAFELTPTRMAAAYHELYRELGATRAEICA